jgi:hypothetical protein
VIAKRDSGQNSARFQPSTDRAGIRRLLGQAALSPANQGAFFLHLQKPNRNQRKIVNL